ncbi:hypothetical protein DA792_10425 [Celeribacter baekdonensis]|uniref:Uncharacterized protein n=1 Tax=Celeribacter baekdonensis TaxID=875171 RepID=A0A2R4M2X4_9RHOB|nr:hypothetical protein DA792_10425 [Celeribacter baekdonensis]
MSSGLLARWAVLGCLRAFVPDLRETRAQWVLQIKVAKMGHTGEGCRAVLGCLEHAFTHSDLTSNKSRRVCDRSNRFFAPVCDHAAGQREGARKTAQRAGVCGSDLRRGALGNLRFSSPGSNDTVRKAACRNCSHV